MMTFVYFGGAVIAGAIAAFVLSFKLAPKFWFPDEPTPPWMID